MEQSLFEKRVEDKGYGFFGYEDEMSVRAIRQDRPDMVRECIERGWIVPETKTLDGRKLVWHAKRNGKVRAAETLIAAGWEDEDCPINAGRFY